MNLADIRRDYTKQALELTEVADNPFDQFAKWMDEAVKAELPEPTAMTVSTVSAAGKPSARVILLKGVEEGQFIFYTNYKSRKGEELAANPFACMTFFWAELERQVRIEGKIAKVAADVSDAYFDSRPKGSRIGAHVSPQSQPIPDRGYLEQRAKEIAEKFGGTEAIPRPEHWGGYGLAPECIEFWQGRPSRLHDRILYQQAAGNGGWEKIRLAP